MNLFHSPMCINVPSAETQWILEVFAFMELWRNPHSIRIFSLHFQYQYIYLKYHFLDKSGRDLTENNCTVWDKQRRDPSKVFAVLVTIQRIGPSSHHQFHSIDNWSIFVHKVSDTQGRTMSQYRRELRCLLTNSSSAARDADKHHKS